MQTPVAVWRGGATALVATGATLLAISAVAAQPPAEQADLVENQPVEFLGNAPTLRLEDSSITRYEDRLVFEIRMDTPEPGSYVYPQEVPGARQAAPEVFTAWAFVFNHPEHCLGTDDWEFCGPGDFSEAVKAGVYGVAGHVSSVDHEGGAFILDRGTDGQVVLRGEIALGDEPWPDLPPGATTFPLENPTGAEVHLAIAPHGQVDPATVATELYAPVGNPGCGCWWVSYFGLEGYDGEDQ
jgi:hypothetical protein